MNKSHLSRLTACFLAVLLALCACAAPESTPDASPEPAPGAPPESEPAPVTDAVPREVLEAEPSTGSILLCGEYHSYQPHLDRELVMWQECYNRGMRHLILELGYCTAQLLNQWMAAEDDAVLHHVFESTDGTAGSTPTAKDFYKQIKRRFPETIFHGIDVEHLYQPLGAEYLTALEERGLEDSEDYRLALQNIRQAEEFYELDAQVGNQFGSESWTYREDRMYENFARTFDALEGEDVMGIFGGAHVSGIWYGKAWNNGDSMAQKLRARYGDQVTAEDLATAPPPSIDILTEPLETVELEVNGKTYPADYYGLYDISDQLIDHKSREIWQLEGAYDDLSAWTATGKTLSFDYYPMAPKVFHAYAIRYTLNDGSERWEYHLYNGLVVYGRPATEEVEPPAAS